MTVKRIALVGLGAVAPVHLKAILNTKELELAALCDMDEAKLLAFQKMLPEGVTPSCYQSLDALLEADLVDAYHLLLPHHEHEPAMKKLILRNKRFLCEKPLCHSLSAAESLMQSVRSAQSTGGCFALPRTENGNGDEAVTDSIKLPQFGLCLQNRYNPSVREAKRLILSGELGALLHVTAEVLWMRPRSYFEAAPWRGLWAQAGGGCMINQAIHTIDLLTYLMGPIKQLRGKILNLLDLGIEVEDSAMARFTYENGATGYFQASLANSDNESVRISMRFEKGELRLNDYQLLWIEGEKMQVLARDTKLQGDKTYYGASHETLIRRFYALDQDSHFEGEKLVPELEDGLPALRFIEAVYRSSREGRAILLEE